MQEEDKPTTVDIWFDDLPFPIKCKPGPCKNDPALMTELALSLKEMKRRSAEIGREMGRRLAEIENEKFKHKLEIYRNSAPGSYGSRIFDDELEDENDRYDL